MHKILKEALTTGTSCCRTSSLLIERSRRRDPSALLRSVHRRVEILSGGPSFAMRSKFAVFRSHSGWMQICASGNHGRVRDCDLLRKRRWSSGAWRNGAGLAVAVSLIAADADKQRARRNGNHRGRPSADSATAVTRRRVDRAGDPQPSPSRKLDLDHPGAG
jgi:hypothetical protein